MNPSTEKMLREEIPRIRELLERIAPPVIQRTLSILVPCTDPRGHLLGDDRHCVYCGITAMEMAGHILKEGVTETKNGRYMRDGKFISKEEAYD